MVFVADTPVERGDEAVYYGGFALPHDTKKENVGAIGLMTAERDQFIGIRPVGKEPCFVLTRPFEAKGRPLSVNARVKGSLRAEIRVGNNKTIDGWKFEDCDPVTRSGYDMPITWRGKSLADAPPGEISLNFKLDNAELFTFDLR